jgi:hypothetical protein
MHLMAVHSLDRENRIEVGRNNGGSSRIYSFELGFDQWLHGIFG